MSLSLDTEIYQAIQNLKKIFNYSSSVEIELFNHDNKQALFYVHLGSNISHSEIKQINKIGLNIFRFNSLPNTTLEIILSMRLKK